MWKNYDYFIWSINDKNKNLSEKIRDELFSYVIVRHGSKQMIHLILILMMILMKGCLGMVSTIESWMSIG